MIVRFCLFCFFLPLYLTGDVLSPNPPVPVSFYNTVNSSVAVAGYEKNYIVIWTCLANSICFVTSTDNGTTWTRPNEISVANNPSSAPWIAANENGFVVVWIDVPPGSSTGILQATFSNDLGNTWSSPAILDFGVNSPATITASESGFLITWWKTDSAYASFASDGQSWSTPLNLNGGAPSVQPIAAGNKNNFLVTWSDVSGNGYAAFSNNNGNSWSTSLIASGFFLSGVPLWPVINENGCMITTQIDTGAAYYSFSNNNGSSWSLPREITNGLKQTGFDAVPCTGTDNLYITAAHFNDNSGQISISSNRGTNWNPFVPFTTGYPMSDSIYDSFPALAIGSEGIMTAWVDVNSNAITAFIPYVWLSPVEPPSSLSGKNATNRFPLQTQYYNELNWKKSPTEAVIGYSIYRDGAFITNTSTLSYQDLSISRHKTYTYTVVAYTASGTFSPGVSTTVRVP